MELELKSEKENVRGVGALAAVSNHAGRGGRRAEAVVPASPAPCHSLARSRRVLAAQAEVRIDDVAAYQAIVDAEWTIINDKLKACVDSGAQIILSRLPIGDLATQYFADAGLFCAGRVAKDDLERVSRATGGRVQTTVTALTADVLGTCELFEEKQVGADRYNLFTGCPHAHTATIVLRGGAEQFIDETERSVHDALMIVKSSVKSTRVVAGGGAVEMEVRVRRDPRMRVARRGITAIRLPAPQVSRHLKDTSKTIEGKQQLMMAAFAKALELIPRQLADNAGFDSTDILNRLRQKHAEECVRPLLPRHTPPPRMPAPRYRAHSPTQGWWWQVVWRGH